MKIVVIGDLEGRPIWKDIIQKENPDLTIFLGDYVASRVVDAKTEVNTLEEIIEYKENNPDKVILLRGNHDTEALGYSWAECYPRAPQLSKGWMQANKERFLNNTQWVYVNEDLKIIFSHAGISQVWLDKTVEPYVNNFPDEAMGCYQTNEDLLEVINDIKPCDVFGFIGNQFDMYGDSETQSCVWIRPETLTKCMIDGYTQVVGHTRIEKCTETFPNLWQCDALGWRNYLVIEDGEFKPKELL